VTIVNSPTSPEEADVHNPSVTELRPTPSDTQRVRHLRQVRLVRESLLRCRDDDEKR
jgi:hypothetical protein